MQVQVHYQGLDSTPWLEQFISARLAKLERFLSPGASVLVNLRFENRKYSTGLAIHTNGHDHSFSCDGDNLYESFAGAHDKASRSLGEEKRMLKDRINRKYSSLRGQAA